MKPNTNPFRGLILVLFVVALVFCGTSIYRTASAHQQTDRVYSDIRTLFEQEKVDRFTVDDNNNLTITLKEPVDGSRIVVYSIYNFQLFYDDFNDLVVKQYESGILSSYDYPDSPSPAWMSTILTWVVVLAVMAILWYFLFLRRAQGGGGGPSASQFGKAKARTLAETGRTVTAKHRPVVIITSNAEKELPDAFLRRCVFHYIEFPEQEQMEAILRVHFSDLEEKLVKQPLAAFYWLRELRGIEKKPSTSELVDWIRALVAGGVDPARIEKEIPFAGVLLKKDKDLQTLRKVK